MKAGIALNKTNEIRAQRKQEEEDRLLKKKIQNDDIATNDANLRQHISDLIETSIQDGNFYIEIPKERYHNFEGCGSLKYSPDIYETIAYKYRKDGYTVITNSKSMDNDMFFPSPREIHIRISWAPESESSNCILM
jgi:hypothetical protein